jgi:hypothetical protein
MFTFKFGTTSITFILLNFLGYFGWANDTEYASLFNNYEITKSFLYL